MSGFVYAIHSSAGLIKIGWSADPYRRLSKIRSDSAHACHLLGAVAATRGQEREVHGLLSPWRSHGEWFFRSSVVEAFINLLGRPLPRLIAVSGFVGSATFMKDHSDVIGELGGYLKLADALGLPKGTVSAMKSRNSIPPEHWPAVAEEASRQGKTEITVDLLIRLRGPRQKRAELAREGAAA